MARSRARRRDMAVNRSVKIGDLEYEVKFPSRLRARGEIERAAGGKSIANVFGDNTLRDHCALIWAGIKHGQKKLTVEDVEQMLQEHEDTTRQDYTEVLRVVIDVAFEDKLLGLDANYDHLRRMFGVTQAPAEAKGGEGNAS